MLATQGRVTVANSAYANITCKPSIEYACRQIDQAMRLAEHTRTTA